MILRKENPEPVQFNLAGLFSFQGTSLFYRFTSRTDEKYCYNVQYTSIHIVMIWVMKPGSLMDVLEELSPPLNTGAVRFSVVSQKSAVFTAIKSQNTIIFYFFQILKKNFTQFEREKIICRKQLNYLRSKSSDSILVLSLIRVEFFCVLS
jgi:hypothetical protein